MSNSYEEWLVGGSRLARSKRHNIAGSGLNAATDLYGPHSKLGYSQLVLFFVLRQPVPSAQVPPVLAAPSPSA